ncbi:DUF302 domain-containing protein [Isoptericola halotolerans]|uniref:DUF302 domain-containing protein n=1 Tax=Isoptericola halotolerans TaxID=300560 RepID=UPI0038910487
MSYGISITVERPFDQAVSAVRDVLANQGFGILTEIDLAATLQKKLGVEMPPQVILGACNPPLAHQALQAEESIGLLLPCNVTVRAIGRDQVVVEALDPRAMIDITGNARLAPVADEATGRLRAALSELESA